MSDADLFYGPADAAPAPSTTQSSDSASNEFYSTDAQAEPTNLYDGSVNNQLASSLASLIEAGEIERSEAVTVGRTLTSEAQAVGLAGGDIDTVFRDLNQPIDPKTSQRDRAAAVAALREEYGSAAESKLAAGLKVLRERAPNLAAILAQSAVGNRRELALHVARLGERAGGGR